MDWNRIYQRPPEQVAWFADKPCSLVQSATEKISACRLLEIGAGFGVNAIEMARQGHQVTAIDCAPRAVELARAAAELAGVRVDFQVGLWGRDHFGLYDVIVDRCVFHADPPNFVAGIAHSLTDTGQWISIVNRADRSDDWGDIPSMSEGQLRARIAPMMKIVSLTAHSIELNQASIPVWLVTSVKAPLWLLEQRVKQTNAHA